MLARSKLNSIEIKISEALINNEISHEDFTTIINEEKNYRELSIRMMKTQKSDYAKINSVNLLYLLIGKVDGYIEEKSGNKCLTLVSTDKSKEVLKKYKEFWDMIENLIKKINDKPSDFDEKYMKI